MLRNLTTISKLTKYVPSWFRNSETVVQDTTKVAKKAYISPQMTVKEIQPKRTQAYYDELAEKLANNEYSAFYNPRTQAMTTFNNKNESVSVYRGGAEVVKLDNSPQGFRKYTRRCDDNKGYLHPRNSWIDYWTCAKRLDDKPPIFGWNLDNPFIAKPTRIPVIPS